MKAKWHEPWIPESFGSAVVPLPLIGAGLPLYNRFDNTQYQTYKTDRLEFLGGRY